MARPLRIVFENAWYHIMNRGAAKRTIFYSDDDRLMFLELLNKIHNRYHVEIHAYCLMDNHYHLLIRTPLPNLSQAIKFLNGLYAQQLNAVRKTDGPIFRGRFKSIIVDKDEYLIYLSKYIHLNPVKAGLCTNPWDYKWSSCRKYIDCETRMQWLHINTVLEMFHGFNKTKYQNYADYLLDAEDDVSMNKLLKNFPVFSDRQFVKHIIENYLSEKSNEEIPEERKILSTQLPSILQITKLISNSAEIEKIQIKTRGQINPRNAVIYLAIICGQISLAELSNFFEITKSRVSKIYHDLDTLIKSEAHLTFVFDEIKNNLLKVKM